LRSTAPSFQGCPRPATKAGDHDGFLNERLMNDLRRPCSWRSSRTCWPAHLDRAWRHRLIAHLHGRESARVDAVRIALAPHRAGQSDIALCRRRPDAERKEMLMLYEFGGFALKDAFRPVVGPRRASARFALGARWELPGARGERALRRHAAPSRWHGSPPLPMRRSDRQPGAVTATLARLWEALPAVRPEQYAAIISGANRRGGRDRRRARIPRSPFALVVRATAHINVMNASWSRNLPSIGWAALGGSSGGPCFRRATRSSGRCQVGRLIQASSPASAIWRGEGLALVEAAG